MSNSALERSAGRRPARATAGRQGPMPGFIEPCDPTLHERAPSESEWVYEIKTDGYRAQVHIRDGKVTIYSRSGYDWSEQLAPIGSVLV